MAIAVAILTIVLGVPNIGHYLEAQDEQYMEAMLFRTTPEVVEEWRDFRETHAWFFDPEPDPEPIIVAPVARTTVAPVNVEQWRTLVERYFQPEDVDLALRVIGCESGGNPSIKHPNSSASGLFQHLGRFWPERSVKAGWSGADIFDPEANVAVAAWLRYSDGWHHWNPSRHCWG